MAVVEYSNPSGRNSAIEAGVEVFSLKINFGDFEKFAHFDFLLKDPSEIAGHG
jgi:hypothetical protein